MLVGWLIGSLPGPFVLPAVYPLALPPRPFLPFMMTSPLAPQCLHHDPTHGSWVPPLVLQPWPHDGPLNIQSSGFPGAERGAVALASPHPKAFHGVSPRDCRAQNLKPFIRRSQPTDALLSSPPRRKNTKQQLQAGVREEGAGRSVVEGRRRHADRRLDEGEAANFGDRARHSRKRGLFLPYMGLHMCMVAHNPTAI